MFAPDQETQLQRHERSPPLADVSKDNVSMPNIVLPSTLNVAGRNTKEIRDPGQRCELNEPQLSGSALLLHVSGQTSSLLMTTPTTAHAGSSASVR